MGVQTTRKKKSSLSCKEEKNQMDITSKFSIKDKRKHLIFVLHSPTDPVTTLLEAQREILIILTKTKTIRYSVYVLSFNFVSHCTRSSIISQDSKKTHFILLFLALSILLESFHGFIFVKKW